MIYLDHNATTEISKGVIDAMIDTAHLPLNPSAIHSYGRKGRAALEDARKEIAILVGIENSFKDYQITFTASGTESNNLILSNFTDSEVFISEIEHPSILEYSKLFSRRKIIKVTSEGVIDLTDLKSKLEQSDAEGKLVSLMLANNETGVVQPLKETVKIARKYGALIHSDCIQACGKIKFNLQELDIDFATISSHKFGGPVGASAIIAKKKYHLKPMIVGGGQEKNLRSGSENVMAISGFGRAAAIVSRELKKRHNYMLSLRLKLESVLKQNFPEIEIVGEKAPRLPNTSLIINEKANTTQLIAFDLKKIAISSGSACSSGKVGLSKGLQAMGYSTNQIKSAIRVSIGMSNTEQDIDGFLTAYNEING